MTDLGALAAPEPRTAPRLDVVAQVTLASALLGAIGIVFLVLMFGSFALGARPAAMAFGWINDVLVMVSYLLAAPAAIVLRGILGRYAPIPSALATVVGLASIAAIVVLQFLLVVGVLTFEAEIGPASFAYLGLAAWLVVTGYLGRRSGLQPRGLAMGVLGATYLGYPVWAYWMGREFRRPASSPDHGRSAGDREG